MSTRTGFTLLVVLGAACSRGVPPIVGEPEIERVVITQWNDSTELFLEYPHPVAGRQTGNWAIHISNMKDFKPIRSGVLHVRFMAGPQEAASFIIDAPARDGIFLLDPVISSAGVYRVELALESSQVSSRHVLPEVRVHADASTLPAPGPDEAGGIVFLKEQQWQMPFAVARARTSEVQRTATSPGEVVAPDGALVEVSAPVDGIATAVGNRSAPSVGQSVSVGQLLAVLAPTAQEGGIAELQGRVERLEREVARAARLLAAGAIPARRLEEARHDLEIARAQAEAIGATAEGGYSLRLTAPIAGVIAHRRFVPGGRVRAGDPLFTIVDPRSAWLRVQVPASVAAAIPTDARATFVLEGSDVVSATARLLSVGTVLDPATRTVPVVFPLLATDARFTLGHLARVAVPVAGVETGVTIPNGAIVDDNGTQAAYVQVGGEEFERRILTLGATDGLITHVVAGVNQGEMVVVTGAYQVRLASMSGGEFAGGHAH